MWLFDVVVVVHVVVEGSSLAGMRKKDEREREFEKQCVRNSVSRTVSRQGEKGSEAQRERIMK